MASRKETDPAAEAWALIWQIMQSNKPRIFRLAQEMDLAPMQLHALRMLEPGGELPMRALAKQLFCDPSNVTGIVDRLEARGLIERREDDGDRRVKILTLTAEGERVREQAMRQMLEPPPEIAGLPQAQQVALRDALRQASDRQNAQAATPAQNGGADSLRT